MAERTKMGISVVIDVVGLSTLIFSIRGIYNGFLSNYSLIDWVTYTFMSLSSLIIIFRRRLKLR